MLCDRMNTLIRVLGIKKKDFSSRINFSQAYISMILNGRKQNPSERFYQSVKREFGVNINWLRDGVEEIFLLDESELTPIEKDLMKKYNALPLEERKIIDRVVDALLLKHQNQTGEEDKIEGDEE